MSKNRCYNCYEDAHHPYFSRTAQNPQGLGCCPQCEEIGVVMLGKNGRQYVVVESSGANPHKWKIIPKGKEVPVSMIKTGCQLKKRARSPPIKKRSPPMKKRSPPMKKNKKKSPVKNVTMPMTWSPEFEEWQVHTIIDHINGKKLYIKEPELAKNMVTILRKGTILSKEEQIELKLITDMIDTFHKARPNENYSTRDRRTLYILARATRDNTIRQLMEWIIYGNALDKGYNYVPNFYDEDSSDY